MTGMLRSPPEMKMWNMEDRYTSPHHSGKDGVACQPRLTEPDLLNLSFMIMKTNAPNDLSRTHFIFSLS